MAPLHRIGSGSSETLNWFRQGKTTLPVCLGLRVRASWFAEARRCDALRSCCEELKNNTAVDEVHVSMSGRGCARVPGSCIGRPWSGNERDVLLFSVVIAQSSWVSVSVKEMPSYRYHRRGGSERQAGPPYSSLGMVQNMQQTGFVKVNREALYVTHLSRDTSTCISVPTQNIERHSPAFHRHAQTRKQAGPRPQAQAYQARYCVLAQGSSSGGASARRDSWPQQTEEQYQAGETVAGSGESPWLTEC